MSRKKMEVKVNKFVGTFVPAPGLFSEEKPGWYVLNHHHRFNFARYPAFR